MFITCIKLVHLPPRRQEDGGEDEAFTTAVGIIDAARSHAFDFARAVSD